MDSAQQHLEALLNEFFAGPTSNQRKKEIESQLMQFRQDANCLNASVFLLSNSANVYLKIFICQVLQDIIDTKWVAVDAQQRDTVRGCLRHLLISHSLAQSPAFVSNKVLQLIADLARIEWPNADPEYFDFILQLLDDRSMLLKGLRLLCTTLEEAKLVSCTRKTPLYGRIQANQFKLAFLNSRTFYRVLSRVVTLLHSVTVDICRSLLKETGCTGFTCVEQHFPMLRTIKLGDDNESGSVSLLDIRHLLCQFGGSCDHLQKLYGPEHAPMDMQMHSELLRALLLLFYWLPRPDDVISLKTDQSEQFCDGALTCAFIAVYLGAKVQGAEQLGSIALEAIAQLLSNVYAACESLTPLSQLHLEFFTLLLQDLVKESSDEQLAKLISDDVHFQIKADEQTPFGSEFANRLIDAQGVFLQQHFHRHYTLALDDETQKSWVLAYLNRLLSFTFAHDDVDQFLLCVDLWLSFLDFLAARKNTSGLESIHDVFRVLVLRSLSVLLPSKQLSLRNQWFSLDEISHENESEYAQYAQSVCELLTKIAEFFPVETLQLLTSSLDARLSAFYNVDTASSAVYSSHSRLLVLDIMSLLRAIGCLSYLFINEQFWKNCDLIRDFSERLCRAAVFCSKQSLCGPWGSSAQQSLCHDARDVFVAIVLCQRNYAHWLAQFYAEAQRLGEHNHIVSALISSELDVIIPLIKPEVPENVVLSCASLLYSLLLTVRPQYLLSVSSVQKLYQRACSRELCNFSRNVQRVLYCCLTNYLILPWFNAVDCEQNWNERRHLYAKIMDGLLLNFEKLCAAVKCVTNQENVAPGQSTGNVMELLNGEQAMSCVNPLEMVGEMLETIASENKKTKQLCFGVLKPYAHNSLAVLQYFADCSEIAEQVLSFLCSLFNALSAQLGPEFTQNVIHVFVDLARRQAAVDEVSQSQQKTLGFRVLLKLLEVLQLIVRELSKPFQVLLEPTLNLVLGQIIGHVRQSGSVDLKSAFYNFLHSVLDIRWRYFVPGVAGSSENDDLWTAEKLSARQAQLHTILSAFGSSLEDTEISVVKQNLHYLNNLNAKWSLYKRDSFKDDLFVEFSSVLLFLQLNSETHASLEDDMFETLSQMIVACEFSTQKFLETVLPNFLKTTAAQLKPEQAEHLYRGFKMQMEVPALSLELQKLVSETRTSLALNS